MRLIFWVLLSVAFGAAANAAGPTCSAYQQRVAPNSPQCFEAATDLQDDDIVYGVQGTGPTRSNQSVKIPVSQLKEVAAGSAPVQSVAGRDGDVTLSTTDISGLGTIATQSAASVAITGGTISGADTSSAVATATDGTTARTHAARAADRINVKDFGAKGDTKSVNNLLVTTASGTGNVTVAGGSFTQADVGKRMIIDGAGPLRTLGYLASIPVTSSGTGYTSTPSVTVSGTGSALGVVALAGMAVQSATVVSGGTGCPASQTISLTLVGGTLSASGTPGVIGNTSGVAAVVSGTTNGSGVLTGALTVVTRGSYRPGTATTTLLASSAVSTTGVTCTTMPTVLPSWGVGDILIAGQGAGVPLSGVTAAVSSGSAALGTPVIEQVVTPYSGLITAVTDATHVVLDTNASRTITATAVALVWGSDDTAAFTAAKTASDARFAADYVSAPLYAPAGTYLISSSVPTFYHNPAGVVGDGVARTIFVLAPSLSGPLFSWSEDWLGGGAFGTSTLAKSNVGPLVSDFSVTGNITAPDTQDVLVFYDRNDRVQVSHIFVAFLWGSIARVGETLNTTQAYMRESYWEDIYGSYVGSPYRPVFDINSAGTDSSDSTNTNTFVHIEASGVAGVGMAVRSQMPASSKAITFNTFYGVRFENSANRAYSADLLQIGDPVLTGAVSALTISGAKLIGSPYGANALKLTAAAYESRPFAVSFTDMTVDAGRGDGISVQSGQRLRLGVTSLSTNGTSVIVGASTLVSSPVVLDAGGAEVGWSYTIDTTSANALLTPIYRTGNPLQPSGTSGGGVVGNVHDGSATGGIAIGPGAVDLQTVRTGSTQVPAAQFSTIGGGRLNLIGSAAVGATISGGSGHNLQGTYGWAAGAGVNDRGNYGHWAYGSGNFAVVGDAQAGLTVMRAQIAPGVTTGIPTSNQAAVSTSNCNNIPDLTSYGGLRVAVHVRDVTNPGNDYDWVVPNGFITRDSGVGTTAIVAGTPLITSRGSAPWVSAIAISMAADTTNGCVPITVTVPNTNTSSLKIVARVDAIEMK